MKVLAACPKCRTQYDVSAYAPRAKIACRCGGQITVPVPREEPARMVRCGSCGASRAPDATSCSFCGSQFSTVDKGWGLICPNCFCRLPNDARFCVECGLGLSPQRLDAVKTDLACPRCKTALQVRTVSEAQLWECASCGGLWVPAEVFTKLCAEKDRAAVVKELASPTRVQRRRFELSAEEKVKYVPCPACKNLMNRSNYGRRSGVIIDTCRDCGVWLDNNELNRVLQFIESGGLEDARAIEEEEKKRREKEQRAAHVPSVQEMGGPEAFGGAFGPRPPTLEVDLARALDFVVKLFIK